jgi:hypothetical protein
MTAVFVASAHGATVTLLEVGDAALRLADAERQVALRNAYE